MRVRRRRARRSTRGRPGSPVASWYPSTNIRPMPATSSSGVAPGSPGPRRRTVASAPSPTIMLDSVQHSDRTRGCRGIGVTVLDDVERIRAFNRRWTEVIGLLDAGLLETPYSLPEARVHLRARPARRRRAVGADRAAPPAADGPELPHPDRRPAAARRARRRRTDPTSTGATFASRSRRPGGLPCADLDRRSVAQISALLEPLADHDRRRVGLAIDTIERILDADRQPAS